VFFCFIILHFNHCRISNVALLCFYVCLCLCLCYVLSCFLMMILVIKFSIFIKRGFRVLIWICVLVSLKTSILA
jgi:hypothetical protein